MGFGLIAPRISNFEKIWVLGVFPNGALWAVSALLPEAPPNDLSLSL